MQSRIYPRIRPTAACALAIGLFGGAVLTATPGNAGPLTLRLSDGSTTVIVADGGAGDLNGSANQVAFIGAVGNFAANTSAGISGPPLAPPYPHMDLVSLNVATQSGGQLQVALSQTGFTSINDIQDFIASWGGTISGDGEAELSVYIDANDALFSTDGTDIAALGPLTGPAFAEAASGSAAADDSYSVTILTTITFDGAGSYSGDVDVVAAVPEAGSLAMLGAGLLGLGAVTRRRRVPA